MTTVNTIEDLVRILDERPEWNEALRSRVLSRELLNLPQKLADFADSAERRLTAVEATQTEMQARQAEMQATQTEMQATQAEMQATQAEMQARQAEMQARQAEMQARQAEMQAALAELQAALAKFIENTDQRLMALETGQNRLVSDVAPLKAAHARNGALIIVARIARVVGCRDYRVLDLGDVLNMLDDADTDGIPANELTSFENADIIIEATHRDTGERQYIAVEASYTGSWRDVDRATRNAVYLTRFTGRPAHAVVAAQRIRPGIERLIERGEVHWAQILQKELETE